MADSPCCPECGAAWPVDAPEGVCPACELRGALEGEMGQPPLPPLEDGGAGLPRPFGDFVLLEEIARGGMGVVYKARQVSLDRTVAVKLLPFGALTSPAFVKRFRGEASAAASLQHPHIVTVHEVGVHQGQHYLVMNFINGRPLSQFVTQRPLPAKQAAAYLKTVAEAVHHAHQHGILHRDLKPSNVLIDENNQPLVTDFGLAKRIDGESSLTLTAHVLGSPNYMPPEQASSDHGRVTRRSDVYGLGATLYHLLTGRPPFQAPTLNEAIQQVLNNEPASPRVLNPSVPRDLETICLKCLEKEPERRYETAEAVARELERFLHGQAVLARPIGPVGKTWRWCRRRPILASLGIALIFTFAAGLTGVFWQWHRAVAAGRQALRERDRAELLAAEAALEKGQSKLEAGDSWGLFDLVEAYGLAGHDPAFQQAIGRRWSTWHAEWDRRTIAVRRVPGIPSDDRLRTMTLADWPPLNTSRVVDVVDTLTGARIAGPLMHESNARGGAFSPDGRLIATVTENGVIHLWDCTTGEAVRPPCETGIINLNRVSFSPDGRFLVAYARAIESPGSNRAAVLRPEEPGGRVHFLEEHRYPIGDARFSPDGESLAVLCKPDLQLWRTADFRPAGPAIAVGYSGLLEFNNDGTLLAFNRVGSGGIGLLNPRTQQMGQSLSTGSDRPSLTSFSHDGRVWAAFGRDLNVSLWRTTNSATEPYATRRIGRREYGRLSFNQDDSLLAVGDSSGLIHVLSTEDGHPVQTLHAFSDAGPHFLPNGVLAASGGSAAFWDLSASPLPWSALPNDALADSLAFDRSGAVLAVGGEDELRLWSVGASPRLEHVIAMPGRVLALTFSEAESQFVAFSEGGSLTKVEPRTGATNLIRHIDRGGELSACLSPDARKLALHSYYEAFVVDTQSGGFRWLDHAGGYLSVAFRGDSERMAVGVASWKVWLYDVSAEASSLVLVSMGLGGWLQDVAYHPNGNLLAVNVEDRAIRLYDPEKDRLALGAYESSLTSVDLLRFSPDGFLLATAGPRPGGGYGVELWHVDLQRGLFRGASVLPCEHEVRSMVFSPDNRTLVTGGLGTTRVWRLPAEPDTLEDVESRTRATLGFRLDEQGNPVFPAPTTNDVRDIRARLTQEAVSSVTPLDAALSLPPTEALTALQALADRHPGSTVYRELRGRLRAELMGSSAVRGEWNEALVHAIEAIRLGCDDPLTQALRALLFAHVDDIDGYRASCEAMAARYASCDDPAVIRLLAQAVSILPGVLDDYDELIEHVRRSIRLVGGGEGPAYRFYLGAVLAAAGRYENAAAELAGVEQHVEEHGAPGGFDPIELKFLLATCQAHLGNEDAARRWFDAAVAETQSVFEPGQGSAHVHWYLRPLIALRQKDAEAALCTPAPQPARVEHPPSQPPMNRELPAGGASVLAPTTDSADSPVPSVSSAKSAVPAGQEIESLDQAASPH